MDLQHCFHRGSQLPESPPHFCMGDSTKGTTFTSLNILQVKNNEYLSAELICSKSKLYFLFLPLSKEHEMTN